MILIERLRAAGLSLTDEAANEIASLTHGLETVGEAHRRKWDEVEGLRAELADLFAESERRQNAIDHLRAELGRVSEALMVSGTDLAGMRAERDAVIELLKTAVANCDMVGYEGAAAWAARRDATIDDAARNP